MKNIFRTLLLIIVCFLFNNVYAQKKKKSNYRKSHKKETTHKKVIVKYGIASFYANKFHGRKTANGETYYKDKYTAACNALPMNTWIKVTNLKNNKSVIVRINDRMHPKNKRLVDLSKSAAMELGYVSRGLTKVKVEVLNEYKPGEVNVKN